MVSLRLALCDLELFLFTRKQVLDHSPLFRIGFAGEQIFEMGDVSPCNEPVHDSPSIVDTTHCCRVYTQ